MLSGLLMCLVLTGITLAEAQKDKLIEVPLLTYNRGKTAACFASKFLDLAARKGNLNVSRSLPKIALETSDISAYPMLIFSGDLRYKLSKDERAVSFLLQQVVPMKSGTRVSRK
jgi:hypothetical protein